MYLIPLKLTFSRIKDLNLNNPLVIGFGISSKETFDKACQYADGAIVGSAFVKSLDGSNLKGSIQRFMAGFKLQVEAPLKASQ